MKKLSSKSRLYNQTLIDAKVALDSIGIPFHLHSGTALGAHRERDFIKHDNDIDLAVFHSEVNSVKQVACILKSMEFNNFKLEARLGKINRGFELQFVHTITDVSLDIFWVYEETYKGVNYYILSSYYGKCDKYKYKSCIWAYRPYKTQKINFLGNIYHTIPVKTLVDAYGKDWKVPKKFTYEEGLEGGYKSLITDFYKPVVKPGKIAFCFLLYDKVIHNDKWVEFFKEDENPEKSYSLYSHIKEITAKTQKWLLPGRVRTVKTDWCEEGLVWAWIQMLKKGLEDKSNKYFAILSGECVPLKSFWETYKQVFSTPKSRINIGTNTQATEATGLLYADQWTILNRKHARMLINLKYTEEGKKFLKDIRKKKKEFCPDELYPANWFASKYGGHRSKEFKDQFKIGVSTFTKWNNVDPHPIRYTSPRMLREKKDICGSGAIFARKFNKPSAKKLSCSRKKNL